MFNAVKLRFNDAQLWVVVAVYGEMAAIPSMPPQGSPRAQTTAWRRRGQRSNLVGRVRCRCRYGVCGGDEGVAGPGRAKTLLQGGRKMVLGPSPGGAQAEGGETSGFENETRLIAARLSGRAVAGLATAPEPGSLPLRRWLPGVASASMQAFRQLTETTRPSTRLGWWRSGVPGTGQYRGCCRGVGVGGRSRLGKARRRGRGRDQLAAPQAAGALNYAC